MRLHRMYIDEVGNHDLKSADNPNERFLSLTGVIVESEHYRNVISPELEALKARHFAADPDEPVIFHRSDIVNRRRAFSVLKDSACRASFDADILEALDRWEYSVVAVAVDKLKHREQYTVWHYDAYHYCLCVLLERYCLHLRDIGGTGDVMAESRGGKEDMRLKRSFAGIYQSGSEFLPAGVFQESLTSKELKVKLKSANIAGLQLADLVAHPSRRFILRRAGLADDGRKIFGDEVCALLERSKFRRGPNGQIEGYGTKQLP